MQGVVAKSWKKEVFLGIGLLLFIVATISIGIYTTNRANADRLSAGASAAKGADMRIDVKLENTMIEPQSITNAMELDNSALNSEQQGSTSNSTSPDVQVHVDGAPIAVPENGSVHKEITTDEGSTKVDISTQSNNSSGDSRSRSSINIDVDSSVRVRSQTSE